MTRHANNHKLEKPAYSGPAGLVVGLFLLTLIACSHESEQDAVMRLKPPINVSLPVSTAPGEVPGDLMDNIIEHLIKLENLDRETITVVRAESATWPDGAMGCPVAGEMYTQIQIKGYWIVLKSEHMEYDFRASARGHFRRCKTSFKLRLPIS